MMICSPYYPTYDCPLIDRAIVPLDSREIFIRVVTSADSINESVRGAAAMIRSGRVECSDFAPSIPRRIVAFGRLQIYFIPTADNVDLPIQNCGCSSAALLITRCDFGPLVRLCRIPANANEIRMSTCVDRSFRIHLTRYRQTESGFVFRDP